MKNIYSTEFRLRDEAELMEQLRWIPSGTYMETFVTPEHHKALPNVPTPTLGGKRLWDTLWKVDGWTVQKSRVLGTLIPHYRILDPDNIRRVWYLSREQFTNDVHLFANIVRQKLLMEDFRYSIVFSGGGGKGAYQIGVWKYLHEIGLDKKIHGVSGVSVGALNSLLFLQGDYEKAEKVWLQIEQKELTHVSLKHYLEQLLPFLQTIPSAATVFRAILTLTAIPSAFFAAPAMLTLAAVTPATFSAILLNHLQQFLGKTEKSRDVSFSLFSQERLRQIIMENVSAEAIRKNLSDKLVYSMLCDLSSGAYPCCWSRRSFEEICDLVLTSAALPGVYSSRTFDGRICIDGGAADNIPVVPVVKDFKKTIVVHLQPDCDQERKAWRHSSRGLVSEEAQCYHIYPSKKLYMSTPVDTITVNPVISKYRIELGYNDAKEQLEKLVEQEKNQMLAPSCAQGASVLSAVRASW